MEITPERIENCKTCKYKYRDESQEPCAHCTKNAVDNYEPMTNGDYIRSLGDADLAPIIMCPRDRKSTRLNSSHQPQSRMPSSA